MKMAVYRRFSHLSFSNFFFILQFFVKKGITFQFLSYLCSKYLPIVVNGASNSLIP